jgi:Leucine-rich repeat (LRR) protein
MVISPFADIPPLPRSQYDALYELYNATNGPFWKWNNHSEAVRWDFTDPGANPCADNWQGLNCRYAPTQSDIIAIALDHHNLTGYLPDSIDSFPKLTLMILRSNNITGSLTSSIGYLSELTLLDLSFNFFSGELPGSMGLLSKLETLNLDGNGFTSISEGFWGMRRLQQLGISVNHLQGTLSSSIGNLTSLKILELEGNEFSTTIPSTIGLLQNLEAVEISAWKRIIPPIPSSFFTLPNLTSLIMSDSNLECPFPPGFGNLTSLQILDISANSIYGTIPTGSLWNLTSLITLIANDNLLSGSISSGVEQLTELFTLFLDFNSFTGPALHFTNMSLELLYLATNFFTGSYVTTSYQFSTIRYFSIGKNLFTGQLPWIKNMSAPLRVYNVNGNYLTGSLPNDVKTQDLFYFIAFENYLTGRIDDGWLSDCQKVMYFLTISNNLFTGTIPASLGNLTRLSQLSLSVNFLTGTIPPSLSQISILVVLDVSSNELTGTVPSSFHDLHWIEELFLHSNNLYGNLNSFLNSTSQHKLINVDISDNEFSGTLSGDFFSNTKVIQSFAAASNCLTGSLPAEICSARTLLSLSLDGLSTALNCRHYLFPEFSSFNAFTVSNFVEGSIPSCYYEMPFIELLHVSGNGVSGTIPTGLALSPSLIDLSLSHNVLSGTIPQEIQRKSWLNLDLSYNKFTGVLMSSFSSFPPNGSLSLQVNRLSGTVPTSLITTENITILNGNIFECNLLRNNIPQSDSDYSNYSCGSDDVNYVLYAWISALFGIPIILLVVYGINVKGKDFVTSIQKGLDKIILWQNALFYARFVDKETPSPKDSSISVVAGPMNIRRLSLYFHEVRLVLLLLTLYCIVILLPVYSALKTTSSSYQSEYAWTISGMLLNGETAAVCLFVFLSILVMLTVFLFVRMIRTIERHAPRQTNEENSWRKSIFSGNFRESILIYSLVAFLNLVIMIVVDFSYVYIVLNYSSTVTTLAAFGLALFRLTTNNVLLWFSLPYASVCFSCSSILTAPFLSSFHYSFMDIAFLESVILFNNIVIPFLAVLVILPDCFYNALFASSNVESTYSYITCRQYYLEFSGQGDGGHLCYSQTQQITYSPPYIYSFQCSSKIVINYVAVYLLMFILVGVVIPLLKLLGKWCYDRSLPDSLLRKYLELLVPEYFKPLQEVKSTQEIILFSKLRFTVQVNSYVTIFMTFGTLFPPLAVIGGFSVCVISYFEELSVGRLLTNSREAGYSWYEDQIEMECAGVEESSTLTMWSTLFLTCCLYAYIIFDTMGDTRGWMAALPLALVMILLPFIVFVIRRLFMSSLLKKTNFVSSGSNTTTKGEEFEKNDNRTSQIQMIASLDYPTGVRNPIII